MGNFEEEEAAAARPARRRGGTHANARTFTEGEDRAMKRVVAEQAERRWEKVAAALAALGYEKRTPKSVRNRFLRMHQNAQGIGKEAKNLCRICQKFKKGHTCQGAKPRAGDLATLVAQ